MKTIDLGHNYRLRRLDSMNWELEHFRIPVRNGKPTSTEKKWIRAGRYFQSLDNALSVVYELLLKEGDENLDLKCAMDEARRIKDELKSVHMRLKELE